MLCSGVFFATTASRPCVFHSPSLASESLSLACPRESNQREGHPGCDASAARRFAAGGRVPLTAHPVPQRNRRDPSRRPLRAFSAALRRPTRGPRARAPSSAFGTFSRTREKGIVFIGWALAHRWESGGPRPTLSFDLRPPPLGAANEKTPGREAVFAKSNKSEAKALGPVFAGMTKLGGFREVGRLSPE